MTPGRRRVDGRSGRRARDVAASAAMNSRLVRRRREGSRVLLLVGDPPLPVVLLTADSLRLRVSSSKKATTTSRIRGTTRTVATGSPHRAPYAPSERTRSRRVAGPHERSARHHLGQRGYAPRRVAHVQTRRRTSRFLITFRTARARNYRGDHPTRTRAAARSRW